LEKLKILCVVDSLGAGGKERQFLELIRGLEPIQNIDIQIAILSNNVHYNSFDELDIVKHFVIRGCKYDLSPIYELHKICREFRPNIIHSWESLCSIYLIPVAKILKIKLISGIIRNAPDNVSIKSRARNLLIFPFSDQIIANSYAGLKAYKAPKHKSLCIYNGFDQSRLKNITEPSVVKMKFNIQADHVVGMVGRFAPRKDYETFIHSAMEILENRKDVEFIAVGDGESLSHCKTLVKAKHKSRFKFLGNQDDIESIINIFTVGVLTTNQRVHGEGISNSIIEYMALGKPVIATRGGGTVEILQDNVTGFLVAPYDVRSASAKINLLLDDNAISEKIGSAAKEFVLKEFTLERLVQRHLDCYKKCLSC
jgi:glycosyltransferase involved in cell wall biosynthesis